jgi:hypothetical protein
VEQPPLGAWFRLTVAYDASQGLSLAYNGIPKASVGAATLGVPGTMAFYVGEVYVNGTPPTPPTLPVEVDNVVVRSVTAP